jgi:hypothetical protein
LVRRDGNVGGAPGGRTIAEESGGSRLAPTLMDLRMILKGVLLKQSQPSGRFTFSAFSVVSTFLVGGLLLAGAGCLGADDGTATQEDSLALASHGRRGPFGSRGGSTGSPAATAPRGAGGSPGTGGAQSSGTAGGAVPNTQAVISAAQTPDGTAIPQGPGPNGQCPEVLVLLGFWSCPQIGETCSYESGTTQHGCSCVRLNGEGGYPAWVCDQPQ